MGDEEDSELRARVTIELPPLRLSDVPTCALVDELKEREGVSVAVLPPNCTAKLEVEGPATVLDVFD